MQRTDSPKTSGMNYGLVTGIALAVILLVRVIAVLVSPFELYADEAQYWRWGQEFAWGYYSKPPLIAWLIGATTNIFGDVAWAVRLPAPFLHIIGAGALFFLGRAMYSPRVGMFAALMYILAPGIAFSSAILSTDGLLLPLFCLALLSYWNVREGTGGLKAALALGACIGLGLLTKYAMIYFVIGFGLTLVIDRKSRKAMNFKTLAAIVAPVALIFGPHMVWNAQNGFKTVSHTVDNANLGGQLFNPDHAVKFFVDQMGVFGPIAFLALIGGLIFLWRRPVDEEVGVSGQERWAKENWLLSFTIPVLIIILTQAVLSRAHAN